MVVDYPEMKIAEANASSDKERMTLKFWYIPMPEDGVDRAVIDAPLLNTALITSFRVGITRISTFLGRDGREVYVNERKAVNSVARQSSINIQGISIHCGSYGYKSDGRFCLGLFQENDGRKFCCKINTSQ